MNRSNRENVPGKGAMYQFVTPPVKRLAPRAEQIGFTSTKQDKLDAADPALGHPFIFLICQLSCFFGDVHLILTDIRKSNCVPNWDNCTVPLISRSSPFSSCGNWRADPQGGLLLLLTSPSNPQPPVPLLSSQIYQDSRCSTDLDNNCSVMR